MTLKNGWRTGALILSLVLSVIALGVSVNTMGQTLPDWVEIQEGPVAHGVDKFYRNAYFKGNVEVAGDMTVAGDTNIDDVDLTGDVTLGSTMADKINIRGQMLTYDGTDNWTDIANVGALSRATGWHNAYKITGWGTGTGFQALFANTQVSATMGSGKTAYGIEGKATASNGYNHAGMGIGIYGKMTVKDTGTKLATGYPFYSIIDVNNSAVITNSANYYAELSGESTLGTVSLLKAKAGDTWDYGLDLAGATLTNDIVGQNSETISNSPNGEWDFGSANLDTSGDIEATNITAGGAVEAASLTLSGDLLADNGTLTGTLDVGSSLNFGANSLYPVGYDAAGYAFGFGTDTVTDTLVLTHANVTTPTIGLCTLGEDPDADEALCTISIAGTTATLKLWATSAITPGSAGTLVHWMIIGQE